MKKRAGFYCTAFVLFVCVILLSLPGRTSAQNPSADWTLMFYMDCDNNLEDAQLKDLDEMMAVGSSENVNVIVLCDRNPNGDEDEGYTNRDIGGVKNWTTAKLLFVERGKLHEFGDWGEVNMGDPATLKKFMQIATSQFPAKHYGLVFGDHGAGWMGICTDESSNEDSLDTNELPLALKDVTAKVGKLDLIGFDACLMANLEVARSIAPYGKIMVASEELEPGNGWWYTPLLGTLLKNPQMDGAALGKLTIDTYNAFYLGARAKVSDKAATLSEINLDKISAIETAVSNLGVRNQAFMRAGGRTNWLHTARARSRTEEFASSEEHEFNYYDLVDYAENLKHENADAPTVQAADAVIAAVESAIMYKVNGDAHPNSNGLSIYFPPDKKVADGEYVKTLFAVNCKWTPFLFDFLGITSADTQAPQVQPVTTNDHDVAKNDVITVTSSVKADDVDEAKFVLAETDSDGEIIIGAIPAEPDEKGVLKQEWDGNWFSIGDGKKELVCPITGFEEVDEAKDTYLAEVPAQVRYKGTNDWHPVTLYFYLDFNGEEVVGEFVYAFEFQNDRAREVEIEAGDSIRPVYVSIDKKGEISEVAPDAPENILRVTAENNITVGRISVAAGKYLVGFTVTDYSDNTSEEFTEVTVE